MAPTSLFVSTGGKRRAGVVMMTLLVLLALVLAACGGGTSPNSSSNGNGAKNSVLTVVPSPIGDFTKAFSPYVATPRDGTRGLVYETLMFFNQEDGTSKPWLASSTTFSQDAKTITFNLRTDVKWSDGQAFSSDDVVFTLNMLKQYPAADGNALWNSFPTLDGLGPRGEHSHCSEHDPAEGKEQEWVDVDSFVPKMVLNTVALLRLPGLAAES